MTAPAPSLADEYPARVRFVNGRTRHRVRRPEAGTMFPRETEAARWHREADWTDRGRGVGGHPLPGNGPDAQ